MEKIYICGQGGWDFRSSEKRPQHVHPQLMHWWLLVHCSMYLGELEGMSTWMHKAPPRLASSEHWDVTMKFVLVLAKTSLYLETLQKKVSRNTSNNPILKVGFTCVHQCSALLSQSGSLCPTPHGMFSTCISLLAISKNQFGT